MQAHRSLRRLLVPAFALASLVAACALHDRDMAEQRLWWAGYGPVLPHDTFPAECSLCHAGNDWQKLVPDFEYDHEYETGVPLPGAHARAACILCHNDRGPVAIFQARGCAGCHEDVHKGQLGTTCTSCHTQETWAPYGQVELHRHTRLPLIGVHAVTACHRCHPGAEVGNFVPTPVECINCHMTDFARATNPPHAALGYTECQHCHLPRTWTQAETQ